MLHYIKEALIIRVVDIMLEAIINKAFGGSSYYDGNPRRLDADSYILAKDIYGEKVSESTNSLNFYLKNSIHRLVKEYLPGEGSFKTFLFKVVDVSAFYVDDDYLYKYSKIDKKYQNATNKEEAQRYREQLRELRKYMMDIQPVSFQTKRMEIRGEIRDASTITITLQKGILEFCRKERVVDGVFETYGNYRLKAIGELGHEYIDLPMVALPDGQGDKKHVYKIVEDTVNNSLYRFGAPTEVTFVLSSEPASIEDVDNHPNKEVEVNA